MSETNWQVPQQQLLQQKDYAEQVRALLEELYPVPPLAYVHSYGCQGNVSDGEKLKGMLADMGYGFCDQAEQADLVLFNTCAIRENAEDRIFGNVGALKRWKAQSPKHKLLLCGCMMQQPHIVEKLKQSYPYVDLIFGTHVIHQLPELLLSVLQQHKRVFYTPESDGVIAEGLPIRRDGTLKAWVPIMYGCNNFCTYCIVPYVKGRERSRQPEAILAEVRQLVEQGYKEITLLGQNVNSYGKTLEHPISFAQLLTQIDAIPGDFRIRFMTSHPKDATKELFDVMANSQKICHHLHLPVQCGSDRILQAMNRRYTVEQYLGLIDYARSVMPDISFTTDIIVGFPGETLEDFQGTMELLKKVRYDSLFSFIYSKRVGTKAASMPDDTPHSVKSDRLQQLLALQRTIGEEVLSEYVGKTLRILVDGAGKSGEGYLTGRTDQFLIVDFPGDSALIGQFVTVKITKALNWALLGELVSA
ncbi:MAG TPA: tRNA (N6-isopentenyl adenosine(37)-C2)-methylthiotransferase MiaB [Candidatus Egerieicola faecale]|uniref:tRNA-2-methylthio-N(6)-dimethylallyladenosine synthase n=1 Tax=Candidatus Egerieicola faecale TaxID=2840774 RepID=A0A9D1IS52_9FIRM|nr:tRNA (N6-isopentenyl adenosine(37)-C2)-methylthiotransferase MiaB [Candidatus Egerieicola faecale]